MRRALALILLVPLTAGCLETGGRDAAGVDRDVSCLTNLGEDALEIMRSFDAFNATELAIRIHANYAGREMESELSLDRVERRARYLHSEGVEYRFDGPWLAARANDTWAYGRSMDPRGAYAAWWDAFQDESEEIEWVNALDVEDYVASCVDADGRRAVQLTYDAPGQRVAVIHEAEPPYRLLRSEVEDAAAARRETKWFSYEAPSVVVAQDAPRMSARLEWLLLSAASHGAGGARYELRVENQTTWVPLSEIRVELHDNVEGRVGVHPLQVGAARFATGEALIFSDLDENGLLSPGDEMVFELGATTDFYLFDLWAEKYVRVERAP